MYNFYPNENNRLAFYDNLLNEFPFIQAQLIGKSLVGRGLHAFSIGNAENRVLIAAAFHGGEWLTINLALHFLRDLCLCLDCGKPVCGLRLEHQLNKRGITFIPCVNPDGVEIDLSGAESAGRYAPFVRSLIYECDCWQANARGVDINHNFPAGWDALHRREQDMGIYKPSPTRYGGTHPASEPETQAVMDHTEMNRFSRAYALHSQGRETYYDFKEYTPPASPAMSRVLSMASGYKVSKPPLIADGGGFKDWFIERFHQPGFTFEIGRGKNPLPLSDESSEYQRILKALCLTLVI